MSPTSSATLTPTANATVTNAELAHSRGPSKPKSPKAAASRGSYRTGIRRRQQIIEAATRHFAQRGYVGASLRDVAADVGVTAGAILRHFGTKEALHGAVVMEWWAQERAQCSPADVGLAFCTAYRIRTGDLRLERAVSWASRRMRPSGAGDGTARPVGMIPDDAPDPVRGGASRGSPRMASATCW